ncbi:unnamed protein product [Caenorhabditis angaria]|uniref:RING-type domain-containing protein n=1 Tax=Caenorhabditis angaria TaxID=860376 RepID=A0A9P1I8R4_9PELO|nr:unnamed protein product [Caenorhabditis angaria]
MSKPKHPKTPKKLQETAEQKRQRVDKAKKQSQHECSICLGSAEFAVVTDCGHVFCCRCIIEYWQHSKPIVKPVDCAICRTEIFELNPLKFVEDHDLLWESNQKINDYNRRFSKNRKIIDYLRDFPIWAPYLIRQFLKNDTLTLMFHFRVFILFVILFISSWLAENEIISLFYDCVGYFDNFLGAFIFFRYLRSYLNRREAGRVINLDQI